MTGCNYQCSYIVPSVRGRMVCRPLENVVAEVEGLVESGTRHVARADGGCVEARGEAVLRPAGEGRGGGSAGMVHDQPPFQHGDRTLRLIGEKATIVKRLHLPVQSGSDRMLKVMHRGYKAERYRRKIEVFREAVPDGTLSTDIIVGHPGETEEDHEQTLKLVEDCAFDSAYIFKFSPRKGTEAAELGGTVCRRRLCSGASWRC